MPPPCRRQEDSQGLRPPTPVCFTGEGHWPLRGAEVAGVQPSAQGQLVLQGWAPLQAGVTDRCLDTGQPGCLALPLGQPLPAPVPAQALGPCLPGSQSPSLKPCSEVRTTSSPHSGRGSRWGGGQVEVWCAGRTAHSPAADLGRFPKALSCRPVLPRDGCLPVDGAPPLCSWVVLARREARQDRVRRTPALSSRTIWGYFCPKRMRLRPLSPSAGVAPVGVRLRPPSPSHRLQPQPCGPLTDHRALSRGLCGHVGASPAPGCGFHGRECLRPAGSGGRLPWRSRRAG